MTRKIVQIAANDTKLFALCDDGSVWFIGKGEVWFSAPRIPRDEPGRPPAPEPEEPDPDMDLKASELGELLDPAGPGTQQTVKDALDKWKNSRGLR